MHTIVGIVIQTAHLHVGHPNHCTQSKTLVILDSNTQAAVVGRLWGAQMMNVFRSAIFWKYICTMLLYLLFFSTILLFCGGIVPPCGGLWVHMPPHFQCLCNTIPQDLFTTPAPPDLRTGNYMYLWPIRPTLVMIASFQSQKNGTNSM